MEAAERKSYIRLIYARAFRYCGVGLAASALIGGLYGERAYAVFALCAIGAALLCWGWFAYLRLTGLRLFGFKPNPKPKTPYIHQRFKDAKPHRPSFRMDSTDFDDDLTSQTAVSEEPFTERQRDMARIFSRAAAGLLLIAISFVL